MKLREFINVLTKYDKDAQISFEVGEEESLSLYGIQEFFDYKDTADEIIIQLKYN